jgi:hypothetical protein
MKIGNVYDLDSFAAFRDSSKRSGFQDSYAGVVLARNLTQVDPRVFEKKYPDLAFMNAGIEADNTGGYAQQIQSLRLQDLGGFVNAGDASDNKGKISLAGEDTFIKVIEREAHSKWSDTEIKQAELQNVNLPGRYLEAHNKIYMREIDEMGLLGFNGNQGILTYTGYTSTPATGAIGTLTAQQMYDEYATLITEQWNAVNNTEDYKGSIVFTPTYAINKLAATMLNTAGGTNAMSVMAALKFNFPGIEFYGTFRADNAGGAGVSVTTVMSKSSAAVKMRIPVPLRIGEVVKLNSFDFQVDSKYRIAGVDFLEDTAGRRLTGL